MKHILSLLFISALFLGLPQESKAQDYNSAVGLRLGYYTIGNLSYKQFLNEASAFELYAGARSFGRFGFRYTRIEIGALYQHHMDLDIDVLPGLRWYVGAGGYAGLFSSNWTGSSSLDLGVMGGPGLDYKFPDLPINVSLDWYLGLNIIGGLNLGVRQGGLTVRYTIN